MQTDVLVIGGGLAGLAAAYEVARRGLKVVIADESWSLGGQLRQQTQILKALPEPFQHKRGIELVSALIERLAPFQVQQWLGHTLIGLYEDGRFGFSNEERIAPLQAKATLIATGAAESPVAFPGWTLPGIMTAGAAQIMINRERVYPGRNALVIGSSDLTLEVILQMHALGIDIAGIVEIEECKSSRDQELWAEVQRLGIPIYIDFEVVEAKGKGRVEQVNIRSKQEPNQSHSFAIDLVCLDGGRHPILEPFTILNCALDFNEDLGGWVPRYTNRLCTSIESIYVAGNAAGVTSQAGILLTGMIAGKEIAKHLGVNTEADANDIENLWESLVKIEASGVWKARVAHMEHAIGHSLPQQPKEWNILTANGGRNIG